MATWPAKLTASGLVSDSQAKIDSIIDMFNIPASPTDNYILKYDATTTRFEMEADAGGVGSGIALTDLSVGTEGTPSGDGALSYDNSTGVFTYTPATLSGLGLTNTDNLTEGSTNLYYTDSRFDTRLATKDSDDINEGATNQYFTNARADGRIAAASVGDLSDVDLTGVANDKILKYNSTSGNFEIADETGGIALTDLSVSTTAASGNGALSYDNTTGVFTFTPANVSGGSGGHTFYNGGTLANSGSFTPNYSNGDIQFYTVTAASTGNCTMNVPTNMTTSSILRIILYCGAGLAAPQDFDLLFNRTSGNFITPNGAAGFGIIRGDARIFDIFYDGTRHYLVDGGILS